MTQVARPKPRRLDALTLPSEPGNERLALAGMADSPAEAGLPGPRLERLKTAVAEAIMNAIEHGKGNRAGNPVEVEVTQNGDQIIVAITGQGGEEHPDSGPAEEPDLLKKLDGGQSPAWPGLVPHPQHGRRHGRNNQWPAAHHLADYAHRRCGT